MIERGVEEFHRGRTLHRAGPGAIIIVNPETVHTGHAGAPEGWTYRALYPPGELFPALAGVRGTPLFPESVIDDPGCARLLRAAHLATERGDALAASTLLRGALTVLVRRHAIARRTPAERPGREPRAVRLALGLLRDRLVGPPTLEELATAAGLSPDALLRAVRSATGLPPHAYLNQLRVREARALLDLGLPPAEVAARTGFTDQSHLTRHFKRAIGVPPAAYQRGRAISSKTSPPPPP